MKSVRARIVMSLVLSGFALASAACSTRPAVADPDAFPGPEYAQRGLSVQADRIAQSVLIQTEQPVATASVETE